LSQSCSTVGKRIVSQKERINEEKLIDGKKMRAGLWVETLDSTIQIANYKNGLKQGEVKNIYRNGEYSISNYKDNIREGWERFYQKEGILYLAILYKKGNEIQRKSFTPSF
jgi:hypothetical protein